MISAFRNLCFGICKSRNILILLFILALIVRFPLVEYNLPVAAHIDERGSVGILRELRFTSLNPRFFSYPMLYFYSMGAALRFFPFEEILWFGRLFNLLIGCLLSFATYLLTDQFTRSQLAALIAATLTLFSPILIYNASYISVDTLFVALTLFALWGWLRFFDRPTDFRWLAAAVVTGLAISTKYNAVLLLPAVIAVELFFDVQWRKGVVPRNIWAAVMLTAGVGLLLVNLIPLDFFLEIVRSEAAMNSGVDSADTHFIRSTLRKINLVAVGMILLALWERGCLRPRWLADEDGRAPITNLRHWRIYWLFLLIAVVFIIVNPFVLVEWRIFLRDFGLELKKNAQTGSDPFWRQYAIWWWQWESVAVLFLAAIGMWVGWQRDRRATILLLAYLLLMMLMIGTATRGFVRYLSPIVPLVALFAGLGAARLWQQRRIVCIGLLLLGAVEFVPKVSDQIARTDTVDYMHEGFLIARDLQPNTVFAAGFTPIQELRHAGFAYRHLSDEALRTGSYLSAWQTGDLLLVDREKMALVRGDFRPIWASEEALGLYLLTQQ